MDELLSALKAAAEPTRLRLLALCARADLTVTELVKLLGQSQPRLSRHLKLLADAGLLDRLQEGAFAYWRLAQRGHGAPIARQLIEALPADDPVLAADSGRLDELRRTRADRAELYFRDVAASWDGIRSMHVDEAEVEQALLKLVPQRKVRDLLDLGTGTGRMLQLLAPRAEHATGVDRSREMLAIARARLDEVGLRHCVVRQADMARLPFDDASFDLIVCHMALHYAEAPPEIVAEAARVLRPGGTLLLIDFAPHDRDVLQREHAHRWLGFDPVSLARWCRDAGLHPLPPATLAGGELTVTVLRADRRAELTFSDDARELRVGH
jgi:ubiquinone/menaquinone biosynthesis C-methylase UbiE/DNA-binding MarR family transcriptional regulator